MRNSRLAIFALSLLALASCSHQACIKGTVDGASELVVKQLELNSFKVLDTLKTKDGSFSYRLDVAEGQPEFVYLFYKDTRVAAFLLERGETAVAQADTLGNYSVSGSAGSEKLQEVEKASAGFLSGVIAAGDNNAAITKLYIDHYRQSVKYVMENPYSLTVIPVLYEQLSNLPIFAQDVDAIHFRNAADSLKTVYPESRYVQALDKEASRREKILALNTRIRTAEPLGYPDLNLPGTDGKKVALSSTDAKVILVHFWNADEATHKMFNKDVLEPIYKDYHSKGFEIYSVCLGTDKAMWATAVKSQQLPWINVCDGLGAASPAVSIYNVGVVPASYIIADGELVLDELSGADGLRKFLSRTLK